MTGYVSVVSPLINYGLGHITGSLSPWRYMYIVAGSITILWAFVILFFMPPDPIRAKGFSDRERYIAVARMRVNNSGVRNTHFKVEQLWELLRDLKFWLAFFMGLTMLVANGPGEHSLHNLALMTLTLCSVYVHTNYYQQLRLQWSERSTSCHAGWGDHWDHRADRAFPRHEVSGMARLLGCHHRFRHTSRFTSTLAAPAERYRREAFRCLYSGELWWRLRSAHVVGDREHRWLYKEESRQQRLLRRLLYRYV